MTMNPFHRKGSRARATRAADVTRQAQGFMSGVTSRMGELASMTNSVRPTRSKMFDYDYPLLWVTIALLSLGVVMVYSASIAMPDAPKFASYHSYTFLLKHLVAVALGVVAALIVFRIPVSSWERHAPVLFVLALVALAVVLVPYVGRGANGARRWIPLGVMNMQPSEIMKLAVTVYAASYTVRKQAYMNSFLQGFLPMAAAVAVVGALLMMEPDMGAFMVIATIAMGVLFLGGINGKLFGGLVATMVGTFTLLVVTSSWRRARIFAYLSPWDGRYTQGRAYQLTHSLIAFGHGSWFGVGLGGSVEKLNYLPEAYSDFILAVIGEELGFIGVIIVILLFYWIVRRAFEIGRQALALDRTFAGLVAKGIGIWLGVQTFINMGVNLGLLPTKGLTLPLVSYGGSGILLNCVALALLLRVDYENRVMMRGGKA